MWISPFIERNILHGETCMEKCGPLSMPKSASLKQAGMCFPQFFSHTSRNSEKLVSLKIHVAK